MLDMSDPVSGSKKFPPKPGPKFDAVELLRCAMWKTIMQKIMEGIESDIEREAKLGNGVDINVAKCEGRMRDSDQVKIAILFEAFPLEVT